METTDLVLLSAESFEIAPCYLVHGVYKRDGGQLLVVIRRCDGAGSVPVSPKFAAVS